MKSSDKKSAPIAIGKIVGWFGLKGFVKVDVMNKSHTSLTNASKVMVGSVSGTHERYAIEEVVSRKKNILVKFKGIDDRTSAEKLKGKFVFLQERLLQQLSKGRWYVHDVLGCTVISTEGETLGTVNEVYQQSAYDLWEIGNEKRSFLVPVVKEFVKEVDIRQKRITVKLIEGLIE